VCQQAVLHKHLDTVKWLSEHGILKERSGPNNWDTPILTAQAATNNHFEMLEYLHSKGFLINATTCEAAVKHKNGLEMVIWLHQHNLLDSVGEMDRLHTIAGSEIARDWLLELFAHKALLLALYTEGSSS
jgi:hypothetical protein